MCFLGNADLNYHELLVVGYDLLIKPVFWDNFQLYELYFFKSQLTKTHKEGKSLSSFLSETPYTSWSVSPFDSFYLYYISTVCH